MAGSIDPQQRHTYYLSEDERILQPDGPALVGPDGERLELPIKAYEALQHVAQALYRGMGVTVDPRNKVLSFAEASDVLQLPVETLRAYSDEGRLPFHDADEVRGILLTDLLAFQEWFRRQRREWLDQMSQEAHESGEADSTAGIPPPMR